MSILVVGSVAYDTVETPFGRAEKVLGGSAPFFSVAASFFAPVNLVAVVGDDFSEKAMSAFQGRPIDLEGLERTAGKTFHWQDKYSYDLNSRETVCTDLNVFEFFKPRIPDRYRRPSTCSSATSTPCSSAGPGPGRAPALVACDTMNFWISGKPEVSCGTLAAVDILLINDAEARQLSGEWNIVKAARHSRPRPLHLVIKKGEHGVLMFSEEGSFAAPAYPLEEVFDPTGAGDTFAGGFLGYLAGSAQVDEAALRRAVIMGSTLASFCVEAFSLDRLLTLTRPEIDARYRLFKRLTHFEEV